MLTFECFQFIMRLCVARSPLAAEGSAIPILPWRAYRNRWEAKNLRIEAIQHAALYVDSSTVQIRPEDLCTGIYLPHTGLWMSTAGICDTVNDRRLLLAERALI